MIQWLEIVRASLCTLTHLSETEAQPVKSYKLQHFARDLGLPHELKIHDPNKNGPLDILEKLREVDYLGKGDWYPTPTRMIPLQKCNLLISPLPTQELKRLTGNQVKQAGFARFSDSIQGFNMPIEPLSAWLGQLPTDIKRWTIEQLVNAKKRLQSSPHPDGKIEVYQCQNNKQNMQRWVSLTDMMPFSNPFPYYCRFYQSKNKYQYFWADIRKNKIIKRADSDRFYHRRLSYGLDTYFGAVNNYTIHKKETIVLQLQKRLPPEEERLLLAVATEKQPDDKKYLKKYVFDPVFESDMIRLIHQLGYKKD